MVQRVPDSEIEECLETVATLISWYGEAYWPIFEYLEDELETRQKRKARIDARLRPDTDFS